MSTFRDVAFQGVSFKLRLFSTAKQRYQNDGNLSQAGKERALAGVRDEDRAYKSDALAILGSEWRDVAREYDEREQERQALELAESKRWRYDVLSHEREMLKVELAKVSDARELEALFHKHAASGVPERRLALAELAIEHANRVKSAGVKIQAERLLEQLHDTPELKEHREAGAVFTKRALELMQVTQEAHEHYIGSEPGYFYGSSSFLALPGALRIITSVDKNLVSHYELVKDTQEALA